MSGAVQETFEQMSLAGTGTETAALLKQVASERVEAHRRRRAQAGSERIHAEATEQPTRTPAGASRVREAVAARYQNSVSYREFLSQEAERALQQAHAEAEVATRKAEAQMQLLEELKQWTEPVAWEPEVEAPRHEDFSAGLTVRMHEDLVASRPALENMRRLGVPFEADEHEATALDEEIAFRRAPEFEMHAEPVAISGNLIEFPRQLVATRKARPRLAEGPLREESAPEPQLRIFEVEAELISSAPAETPTAPDWQSVVLAAAERPEPVLPVEAEVYLAHQPQTARLELRLMAAIVDTCCVGAAGVAFVAVVAEIAGARLHAMPLPLMGASLAGVMGALFVLYQLLFFTFGEATPGMRYARIGLCTFADSNPTRSAMRGRVLATLLAASPLGLGLAWAWMDEDQLGWHDRISRMYQRAY